MTIQKNTTQHHQTELNKLQQRIAALELDNARLKKQLNTHQHQHTIFEKTIVDLNIKLQQQQQSSFLYQIIEKIPVAIFVKNARHQFRIDLWNNAAE